MCIYIYIVYDHVSLYIDSYNTICKKKKIYIYTITYTYIPSSAVNA